MGILSRVVALSGETYYASWLLQGYFAWIDVANAPLAIPMLMVTCRHSECCVSSGLEFKGWQLFQLLVSGVLDHSKHDMGAPSRLNVETLERASTPDLQDVPPMSALS